MYMKRTLKWFNREIVLYEYNCVSKISITSIAIPETEKRITIIIGDFFYYESVFKNCTGYSNVRSAFETTEKKTKIEKKKYYKLNFDTRIFS